VVKELLARAPGLAVVRLRGRVEGARQEAPVDPRVVRLDVPQQLVDEVLMTAFDVDDGHEPSVLGTLSGKSPPERGVGTGRAAENLS
jgi:hypothetical protein